MEGKRRGWSREISVAGSEPTAHLSKLHGPCPGAFSAPTVPQADSPFTASLDRLRTPLRKSISDVLFKTDYENFQI